MSLKELIAKLEAAPEGSRELDAEIVVAINWRPAWCTASKGGLWIDRSSGLRDPAVRLNALGRRSIGNPPIGAYPKFSSSLDAALTLVPEGCAFQVGCEIDFTPVARVWGHDIHTDEFAATPALALCIAALKSRPQLPKGDRDK